MPGIPTPGYPYILVARDLAPADTATLGTSDVVGLLTAEGGPTSHTAILAKSLGIPAVVNCSGTDLLAEGKLLILDGTTGTVTIDPSARNARARCPRSIVRGRAVGFGTGARTHA